MTKTLAPANLSRRAALGLVLSALPAAACAHMPAGDTAPASGTSLKVLAAAKGLRFGTALAFRRDQVENADIRALVARECNIAVPENELKMYVTHNNNATDWNFGPGDAILGFCEQNAIAMRGHNLYWAKDKYTPKWLLDYDFGAKPKVAAEALLRDCVNKAVDHYGTRLTSWDVVNEVVDEKTGQVRDCVFTRVLGMDALRICFEAARERLPNMELVYNDYMGWETGGEAHRDGVLNLMRWFHDNNIPVNALGLQSHLGTDNALTGGDHAKWKAFLDGVTGLGYNLLITEFDVNDRNQQGDIASRDAVVAKTAREYLDLCLSYPQMKDVLVWGMDDKHSWLQGFSPRADGLPLRPTPFDADLKPKPLYYAIADALKSAPAR